MRILKTQFFHLGFNSFFKTKIKPTPAKVACATVCMTTSLFFSFRYFQTDPIIKTKHLFVLYDAGETTFLTPVLKEWESQKKDFKVVVLATAETLVKPDMFEGRRITLKQLGIVEEITNQTPRTVGLSEKALSQLSQIHPKMVITGVVSKTQEQFLTQFPEALRVALVDQLDYDPKNESFKTVIKVKNAAQHVLCPSEEVLQRFSTLDNQSSKPIYHVVGKPSLEAWENEIKQVNHEEVLKKIGLQKNDKPIVMLVGGYGEGYETINPTFLDYSQKLKNDGFQVFIQPHPKVQQQTVTTVQGLAIADAVVGFNSSVLLDAAIIGKKVIYVTPQGTSFKNFATEKGYLPKVNDYERLLTSLKENNQNSPLRQNLNIPLESISLISKTIKKIQSS